MHFRLMAALAAGSVFAVAGAMAQDAGTPADPAPPVEETADEVAKPGAAVVAVAKGLKDVDGPRSEAAKELRETALLNNAAYQSALLRRNEHANKPNDEEAAEASLSSTGASGDHPTADANPSDNEHPTPDDHPDADSNPGDDASADAGPPEDLDDHPTPDDHPGNDDHPTPDDHPGKPGGG